MDMSERRKQREEAVAALKERLDQVPPGNTSWTADMVFFGAYVLAILSSLLLTIGTCLSTWAMLVLKILTTPFVLLLIWIDTCSIGWWYLKQVKERMKLDETTH